MSAKLTILPPSSFKSWAGGSLRSGSGRRRENARPGRYHAELSRKYDRAARHPWVELVPDPPPPDLTERALFWYERGEYARSLEDYEELLRVQPDSPWAENGRAWTWATCPDAKFRDGKRAVPAAKRACELTNWHNGAVLDTLAAAYAEAGDFPAAVHWQTEALKYVPPAWEETPGFRARLVLYRSGKPYREGPKHR